MQLGPETRVLPFQTISGDSLLNDVFIEAFPLLTDDSRVQLTRPLLQLQVNLGRYLRGPGFNGLSSRGRALIDVVGGGLLPLVQVDLPDGGMWAAFCVASD